MTDVQLTDRERDHAERAIALVDGDVHTVMLPSSMHARLSSRWQGHLADFGPRIPGAYAMYPRMRNGGYRIDARPEEGFAGSDIRLVQAQLLDEYDMDYAVLTPMQPQTFGAESPELAAALCSALNDWTREEWLDQDARLLGSICPPHEHPDLAVAEIERLAGDDRFVQVLLPGTLEQGLGNRRYWPMLRAAAEAGLPVALHTGGLAQPKGAGWPAYYLDMHALLGTTMAGQMLSMVCSGLFDEIPDLQVVAVETGIAWAASLSWTIDDAWRAFGEAEIDPAAQTAVGVPARELVVHHPADRGAGRSRAPRLRVRRHRHGRPDPVLQRLSPLGLRLAGADAPALDLQGGQGEDLRRQRLPALRARRRCASLGVGFADDPGAPMSDVVVVGAGFAGLYALHRLRGGRPARAASSRRATASAAPGTGTATRAPAATSRASSTPTRSPRSSSRSGPGASATPPSRRSCATSSTSPTASSSGPTSSSTRASRPRPATRTPTAWTVDDRARARPSPRGSASWRRAASSRRRSRDIPGLERLRGRVAPHRALAAGGRRLHRQARRRHRHRLDRHPDDPGDRARGGAHLRLPAHGELQRAERQPRRWTPRSRAR